MEFAEKLKRLLEGKNVSLVARAAQLSPTVISNYLHRGSIPRADIGLKLARATGTSPGWLFDDGRDWPPPDTKDDLKRDLASATDWAIIRELVRRRRLAQRTIAEQLDRAERVDWRSLRGRAKEGEVARDLTNEFTHFHILSASIPRLKVMSDAQEMEQIADEHLTPAEVETLLPAQLLERFQKLATDENVKDFVREMGSRPRSAAEDMALQMVLGFAMTRGVRVAPHGEAQRVKRSRQPKRRAQGR